MLEGSILGRFPVISAGESEKRGQELDELGFWNCYLPVPLLWLLCVLAVLSSEILSS